MKQFGIILKHELKNFFKNKAFIGVTVFFVLILALVMFIPRIAAVFETEDDIVTEDSSHNPAMLIIADNPENAAAIAENFKITFPDYNVTVYDSGIDSAKELILSGQAECVFEFESFTSYTYYVNNLSMYDANPEIAAETLKSLYYMNAMVGSGMSLEDAAAVISTPIEYTSESLGKDQIQNFFYAYIMIFALYMVILLYGQMVATNVATEKSSRAMELLITSAKPTSMMFGKVLAACIAGFTQLVAIFGSALLFFNINREYWDSEIANMFLDIPPELLGYMLVFFVLGFLIYAFLFGAIGSTASKLEDINTAVTPLMFMFIFAFIVVMTSMSSGNVDSALMKFCSFFPFTSPMAMFTRIALSSVPIYEIIISIVILALSVFGIGVISAKIYRVGVLLYGTPPKFRSIIKMIKKA